MTLFTTFFVGGVGLKEHHLRDRDQMVEYVQSIVDKVLNMESPTDRFFLGAGATEVNMLGSYSGEFIEVVVLEPLQSFSLDVLTAFADKMYLPSLVDQTPQSLKGTFDSLGLKVVGSKKGGVDLIVVASDQDTTDIDPKAWFVLHIASWRQYDIPSYPGELLYSDNL